MEAGRSHVKERSASPVNKTGGLARLAPAQRIARAVIERADAKTVEPFLVDLERAADEQLRRQFLGGVLDRPGGALEERIAHRPLPRLSRGCVKLRGSSVLTLTQDTHY